MNLNSFNNNNLFDATTDLFARLGIKLNSNTKDPFDATILKEHYKNREPFTNIRQLYFVGLIDNSVFENTINGYSLDEATLQANKNYDGLMLFALELSKHPTRTEISELTRAFNRISQKMPVALLLKYDNAISIALSERFLYKQEWRQGEKVGKIIILRDILTKNTHSGHLRILQDLSKHNAKNFDGLHTAWLKVLNIKTLNTEFYERLVGKMDNNGNIIKKGWYFKCFENIQIDLTAASKILNKKIDDELKPQAVIRVIIRLMFIWFMKEKGLIKNDFFTQKFAGDFLKNKDTYYNAILQNLFFAVLNKKIDKRRFRKQDKNNYYNPEKNDYGVFDLFRFKEFFKAGKAEEFLKLTQSIPFVNGGLFQCNDYKFSGKDELTNKKNTSQNYIIDGFSDNPKDMAIISDTVIFDLIDLFNEFVFTIEESTPMEQDIALDPELLGTVFENLIGFYNPETKENARKQTGSFYTPREIVDYMCSESLKESLKSRFPNLHSQIDKLVDNNEDYLNFPEKNKLIAAITDLKILDPACGSGAFPMGMFNLMVRTIEKLQEHKTTYKNKLDIIASCIYGVDIQNIAVEISKLRFFISLLVDYPTPENIEEFEVLPNLETKFVVANTLIGIEEKKGENHQFGFFDFDKEFQELATIFNRFTTAKTPKEKEQIKNDFNLKKEEIVNSPNFEFGSDTKEKIRAWNPFNVCYCSPFFDSKIFFGLPQKTDGINGAQGGFDIVIGNPPYGFRTVLTKQDKDYFRKKRKIEFSSGDSAELFVKISFDNFVKENGFLTFIIPKKSLYGDAWEDARINYWKKYALKFILDTGKSFENVLLEASAFGLKKVITAQNVPVSVSFLEKKGINTIGYFAIEKLFTESNTLQIYKAQFPTIIEKIEKTKSKEKLVEGILGLGIGTDFYSVTETNYKLMKGIDVEKYNIRSHRWLKNKEKLNWANAKKFLKPKVLAQRLVAHIENPTPHLKITACYDSEGIIITNTLMSFEINTKIDEMFWLGYINSKFVSWFAYNFVYARAIRGMDLYNFYLQQIPIPNISLSEQQPIIALVNKILSAKQSNPAADTTALEREIDVLVYELYGLTAEEMAIIEQ